MNANPGSPDWRQGAAAHSDGSSTGVLDRNDPAYDPASRPTDPSTGQQAGGERAAREVKEEGDAPARPAARLGMLVGDERLLVELAEAGEILPMPASIVPVPLTRDWFLGVTNIRGSLFTVVDLRRFSGGSATDIGKESRLLSLSPSLGFNVTLVISRMLGLRNTSSMTPLDEASPAPAAAPWIGTAFADADGEVWREFSPSKLVAAPEFLVVGR
jgi:twitching motility protein PilI